MSHPGPGGLDPWAHRSKGEPGLTCVLRWYQACGARMQRLQGRGGGSWRGQTAGTESQAGAGHRDPEGGTGLGGERPRVVSAVVGNQVQTAGARYMPSSREA